MASYLEEKLQGLPPFIPSMLTQVDPHSRRMVENWHNAEISVATAVVVALPPELGLKSADKKTLPLVERKATIPT